MFCAMGLLNTMEDSSPCNSTPMNLQSARDRLRREQDCRADAKREQERRRSRTEVRQARLDRRHVHSEESVAFSGSIGVELVRVPLCQLALNTEFGICYITYQYSISLLRLAPTMLYIF